MTESTPPREVVTFDQLHRFNIRWPPPQGFPTPRREISSHEFLEKFLCGGFSPDHVSYHYLFEYPGDERSNDRDRGPGWTCHVIGYHDAALLVAKLHTQKAKAMGYMKLGTIFEDSNPSPDYVTVVRFFRIGCTHPKMTERSRGMFDHLYECPDCGTSFSYDSSG